MKVVALIPARRDSRRFPGKNWGLIEDMPLWFRAVRHAAHSDVCQLIAVSTNDQQILGVDGCKHEPPGSGYLIIQRPEERSQGEPGSSFRTAAHADEVLRERGIEYDALCILQPTSPLRTPGDIAACVRLMEENQAAIDSVVSVTEGVGDEVFHIRHAGRIERVAPFVIPNGAIFLLKTSVLRAGIDWYGSYAYAYCMPKERSIDIDTEFDLEVARMYLAKANAV